MSQFVCLMKSILIISFCILYLYLPCGSWGHHRSWELPLQACRSLQRHRSSPSGLPRREPSSLLEFIFRNLYLINKGHGGSHLCYLWLNKTQCFHETRITPSASKGMVQETDEPCLQRSFLKLGSSLRTVKRARILLKKLMNQLLNLWLNHYQKNVQRSLIKQNSTVFQCNGESFTSRSLPSFLNWSFNPNNCSQSDSMLMQG